MKILVINSGSSSIKYQLLDMKEEQVLCKGLVERIGIPGSQLKHTRGKDKYTIEKPIPHHDDGLKLILDTITDPDKGVFDNLNEIKAIGHRVVHGAEKFSGSVLVEDDVIHALEENAYLAPLHNPPNIVGIRAAMRLLPGIPNVAVFDTAFHSTMPPKAYLYAIPMEYYRKYKIRRYGFHGTSHRYVSQVAAQILGKDFNSMRIITCHLGNGASIAAVNCGKSIDTSMGFTPLEGLVMGTRSGDLDPSILVFLQEKEGKTAEEVYSILNKKSGMIGLSDGFSSDMRDIEAKVEEKEPVCRLAMDIYQYRIAKYIGAYTAAMNGVDAIVFTAGVGENAPVMRMEICHEYLGFLGVTLDPEKNNRRGEDIVITTPDSRTPVLVIGTNEELVIARDTREIVEKGLKAL
ncbi:MAG TPA: acetate kinase [Thermotogota bacterium]|nr:acetate kinase [Thermotogota bacterium]HOZ12135.1 acetate kinase [Thermotogota bacterium]HPB87778.1 acetate kinase [Thermotogota bacterium]HPM20261.1 acetate kinase [Thermotogota bacterium]HQN21598.1 acetate kinase [Thermotogota bacterium]